MKTLGPVGAVEGAAVDDVSEVFWLDVGADVKPLLRQVLGSFSWASWVCFGPSDRRLFFWS